MDADENTNNQQTRKNNCQIYKANAIYACRLKNATQILFPLFVSVLLLILSAFIGG